MTKILVLMRHGEEEPDPTNPHLTENGIKQAQQSAQYLIDNHIFPECAFHSGLARTQETLQHVMATYKTAGMEINETPKPDPRFLLSVDLYKKIGLLNPSLGTVLIVDHAPDIKEALQKLSPEFMEDSRLDSVRHAQVFVLHAEGINDWGALYRRNTPVHHYIPG